MFARFTSPRPRRRWRRSSGRRSAARACSRRGRGASFTSRCVRRFRHSKHAEKRQCTPHLFAPVRPSTTRADWPPLTPLRALHSNPSAAGGACPPRPGLAGPVARKGGGAAHRAPPALHGAHPERRRPIRRAAAGGSIGRHPDGAALGQLRPRAKREPERVAQPHAQR